MSYGNQRQSKPMPRQERKAPQSLEAEQSVIGAALMEKSQLELLIQLGLQPDHFYRELHRTIWRGMVEMHLRGWPVDLITLIEQLRRYGKLEEVGGAAYITAVIEGCPNAERAAFYAEIVMEKSRLRSILLLSEQTMAAAYREDADSLTIIRESYPVMKIIAEGGVFLPPSRGSRTITTPDTNNYLNQ